MKKTLQERYNLIKQGKGDKREFLKEAKQIFPNLIDNSTPFNNARDILKSKQIISEGYVDLKPINNFEPYKEEGFETEFKKFLKEQEEKIKAEEKKTSKSVTDLEDSNHDSSDKKDINNISQQQILKGAYAEAGLEKNQEKELSDILDIVIKNLTKDPQYYMKNFLHGVEGLGMEQLEDSDEVKGEHKSSGYGDLDKDSKARINESFIPEVGMTDAEYDKEMEALYESIVDEKLLEWGNESSSIDEGADQTGLYVRIAKEDDSRFNFWLNQSDFYAEKQGDCEYLFPEDVENYDGLERFLSIALDSEDLNYQMEAIHVNETQEESFHPHVQLHENKNMDIQQKLKEIEKSGMDAALQHKIEKLQEAIDDLQAKMDMVSENEGLSEFVDKKSLKVIEKSIKELGRAKEKLEKVASKGGKKAPKAVVDSNDEEDETVEESLYATDDERYYEEKDDAAYEEAYAEMDLEDEMEFEKIGKYDFTSPQDELSDDERNNFDDDRDEFRDDLNENFVDIKKRFSQYLTESK